MDTDSSEEPVFVLHTELSAEDLKDLVRLFKAEVKRRKGVDFPDDAYQQLWGAIGAVFGSWNNHRAVTYRELAGF